MNVCIVSPGYPETPGGVTDHTARLVRHWTDTGTQVVVLGTANENPERVVREWHRAGVRAILIQYVPFLYGRRGLSSFPLQVALHARPSGMRVALFIHEPWVPPTRLPWLLLSPLQRRQLLRLVRICDTVVTPVPVWRDLLGAKASLMYVGSTLGEPPLPGDETSLPAPVVFSPLASGLNWAWIAEAVEAVGATPGLIVIGADWETARRHRRLRRWADPAWEWRGFLERSAVLSLLARARLVLAPFVDGLTGRRTSALAAASVGAPLLSSRGHLFDRALETGPFALANTAQEFRDLAVSLFARSRSAASGQPKLEWYQRHLAPAELDQKLLALLGAQ